MKKNLNSVWSFLLVEELVRQGVTQFVIAPGSRSTPLTCAVAAHPKANAVVHFDERGCAFFAIGYARATQRPAALICTSGTAVANYLPAIVEAYQEQLPLVILSADRPPELLHTGANQTIEQRGLFGSQVILERELPCPTADISPKMVLAIADELVAHAHQGPVHLNCAFRKPLDPRLQEESDIHYLKEVEGWLKRKTPYTRYHSVLKVPAPETVQEIVKELDSATQGVIVVGRLLGAEEREAVRRFSEKINWPLYADITSGMRLGPTSGGLVPYFEQVLAEEELKSQLSPDVVLQIGGRFVSQRLQQWLEVISPKAHIAIRSHSHRIDPSQLITQQVEADITTLLNRLTTQVAHREPTEALHALQAKSSSSTTGEQAVAVALTQMLPEDHALFLASSSAIRLVDRYGRPGAYDRPTAANRGASGIDGTIASAAGFAEGLQKRVTLLIGDLALLHDINSLALLKKQRYPLTIIVLNNNGGGIFSQLPIAKHGDVFETYFKTPHDLNLEGIVNGFGVKYRRATDLNALCDHYHNAIESESPSMVIEAEGFLGKKNNLVHTSMLLGANQ